MVAEVPRFGMLAEGAPFLLRFLGYLGKLQSIYCNYYLLLMGGLESFTMLEYIRCRF